MGHRSGRGYGTLGSLPSYLDAVHTLLYFPRWISTRLRFSYPMTRGLWYFGPAFESRSTKNDPREVTSPQSSVSTAKLHRHPIIPAAHHRVKTSTLLPFARLPTNLRREMYIPSHISPHTHQKKKNDPCNHQTKQEFGGSCLAVGKPSPANRVLSYAPACDDG